MNPLKSKIDQEFEKLIRENNLEDVALKAGLVSPIDIILDKIITADPIMLGIKQKVKLLAKPDVNIPVLILGDTGTGKELIAQALSAGRKGPFVPVNCSGIPDTLLESEFFGCVKGSFTGATDRKGFVEEANDGTLFLDEIGDMPLLLQSKLLRLLQSRMFRRVGETTERKANFRLVSATNVDDIETNKNFRRDLYYRLAGTRLELPSLRNRGLADINLIIEHFARPELRERIKIKVESMPFPGNIRQLLNIIEETNILD